MLKQVSFYSLLLVMLASCSSIKTAFTASKQPTSAQSGTVKKGTKFLDEVEVPIESSRSKYDEPVVAVSKKETPVKREAVDRESEAEGLSQLQVKYAVLLNTPAEEVRNTKMFEFIDEWYGTPYRLGGTTKKGVDCSEIGRAHV